MKRNLVDKGADKTLKKKAILLTILLLSAVLVVVAVLSHSKDPMARFIEQRTNYTVCNCVNEKGEIDVIVNFQTDHDRELYAQYCARLVLSAIQHFPRQVEDTPKEVTVRLYNKSTKQTFLRISVKGTRCLETSWDTLLEDQIPSNVDYYYFNESSI